jgi:hypothetical protein
MFCKREIVMSDRTSGNWLPYDLNGEVHECKKENQTGTKKVEKSLSLEELDARLKRVESIIIGPQPKKGVRTGL